MSGTVRLMHFDPQWRQEFEQTRSSILMSCVGWVQSVEHVGGTAMDGLVAQPIIDAVAGVAEEAGMEPAQLSIEGLNFRTVATPDWADGSVQLIKPRHGEVTHRVFLTEIDSPVWRRLVVMRDWLRSNREAALSYEEGKVDLWKTCHADRHAYQQAMADFFADLEDRIWREREKPDE